MSRRPAQVTRDEIARAVKAVTSCGLSVYGVTIDGAKVHVITTNNGQTQNGPLDKPKEVERL